MKRYKLTMRDIPAIERLSGMLLNQPELAGFSRDVVVERLRTVVSDVRKQIRQEQDVDVSAEGLAAKVKEQLGTLGSSSLRKAVNATGVVLHTNLGRAPLGKRAIQLVNEVMAGYSTLEYNVATGERGSRYEHVVDKLCTLTGAEDAIIVNNNAAAVLLVLSALAKEREVIVSRGQLVEIGGAFRIPDVLAQSGARLVEVGATNKTHLKDFERAITERTALILKVHTSNYRIVGFTAQPEDKALAALAHQHGIPLVEDLGSGVLCRLQGNGWQEPTVRECLAAGMDLVTFSGDKLLGAGQAGIIAGKRQYIEKMKIHPLLRALRIDKLSLAAVEGTLLDYLLEAGKNVPVQRMLNRQPEELKELAHQLAGRLQPFSACGWRVDVVPLVSQAGGGTLPEIDFASFGVSIVTPHHSAAMLESVLRKNEVPIIVRIQCEKILLDVRCLAPEDMAIIETACTRIAKGVLS
ncbi:L-seryl-tRNA(Sec) selenium transferase [Anaerospora hongkongensis]|uniref:L-seryl-tRNA(Sec) selenium transferase n=1 Tax=Anaerospora hongkongensis TaxID=244830 RepID=UPI0028A23C49|nr:L-seryl-tRNA(Sec) selenium transferase [Anaerospora hongkongensis]